MRQRNIVLGLRYKSISTEKSPPSPNGFPIRHCQNPKLQLTPHVGRAHRSVSYPTVEFGGGGVRNSCRYC